jgi:hypothetical protein
MGNGGVTPSILLSTVVSFTPRTLYPRGKEPPDTLGASLNILEKHFFISMLAIPNFLEHI